MLGVNDGIHNKQVKYFYDLEPLENELFEVIKKYDLPHEFLDSALIDVRQSAIKYFNKKRAEN